MNLFISFFLRFFFFLLNQFFFKTIENAIESSIQSITGSMANIDDIDSQIEFQAISILSMEQSDVKKS